MEARRKHEANPNFLDACGNAFGAELDLMMIANVSSSETRKEKDVPIMTYRYAQLLDDVATATET
jgi:hypothetical protein